MNRVYYDYQLQQSFGDKVLDLEYCYGVARGNFPRFQW